MSFWLDLSEEEGGPVVTFGLDGNHAEIELQFDDGIIYLSWEQADAIYQALKPDDDLFEKEQKAAAKNPQ